jgi:RNA polymerase sigma-54 factor
MKQSLQLRTSQHLALTPQLQQSIRLLQLSTLELHQEIGQLLADNPLLERADEPQDYAVRLLPDGALSPAPVAEAPEPAADLPAPADEAEGGGEGALDFGGSAGNGQSDDDDSRPQLAAQGMTLREHLLEQMRVTVRNPRDRALVEIVIDALDENGYLEEPLVEIHARMPAELGIEIEEFTAALKLVQSFDPAGVGARDAGECLALQIRQLKGVPFVTRRMALAIVEQHLAGFAQRDFTRLKKALGCDDEDLREAQEIILRCTPHPGAAYSAESADYIVPDVIVRKIKNTWQATLNRDVMPRLRVNAQYAGLMKQNKGDASLGSQLQEAKWLIKNMRQRFDTILRVAQAIVERQRNFFSHGAVAMRPLVLREIADTLGLHESTISRVTTQKFMLTPHGMFELKYFFGSHVATEAGGEASSTAIRALIVQLIGAEDRKIPLSDSKIADMLGEQGMVIARRTVAKYREALKIPPVSLRKAL